MFAGPDAPPVHYSSNGNQAGGSPPSVGRITGSASIPLNNVPSRASVSPAPGVAASPGLAGDDGSQPGGPPTGSGASRTVSASAAVPGTSRIVPTEQPQPSTGLANPQPRVYGRPASAEEESPNGFGPYPQPPVSDLPQRTAGAAVAENPAGPPAPFGAAPDQAEPGGLVGPDGSPPLPNRPLRSYPAPGMPVYGDLIHPADPPDAAPAGPAAAGLGVDGPPRPNDPAVGFPGPSGYPGGEPAFGDPGVPRSAVSPPPAVWTPGPFEPAGSGSFGPAGPDPSGSDGPSWPAANDGHTSVDGFVGAADQPQFGAQQFGAQQFGTQPFGTQPFEAQPFGGQQAGAHSAGWPPPGGPVLDGQRASGPAIAPPVEGDQPRFDAFQPEAAPETPPVIRNGRVLLAVLAAAALLLVVPLGIVWLTTRSTGPSFEVGSCVRRSGAEAVAAQCTETGAFTVVSKVDSGTKCTDPPGQPYVVVAANGGKDQVLCLKPVAQK